MSTRQKSLIIFVFCLFVSRIEAGIPHVISYQGIITDTSGNLHADGKHSFEFNLYKNESGGESVWVEEKELSTRKGMFFTFLGDIEPLEPELFQDELWLSISIEGKNVPSRIKLAYVPYAFKAMVSDSSVKAKYSDTAGNILGLSDALSTKSDTSNVYTRQKTDSLILNTAVDGNRIIDNTIGSDKISYIIGTKISPDFGNQHISTSGKIKSGSFGEILQYRLPYANRYNSGRIRVTHTCEATTSGSAGTYLISVSARGQGDGLSGGAAGILFVSKQYNRSWTIGFTQIANVEPYILSVSEIANTSTGLEFTINTNNTRGYYEAFSVVQIGYGMFTLTWTGEVDE